MKESLVPVHVHELSPSEELERVAVNDNTEAPLDIVAANDNEPQLLSSPLEVANENETVRLSEVRERLGISAEESEGEITSERVEEELAQNSFPEAVIGHTKVESAGNERRPEQAAGGASRDEGGEGASGNHKDGDGPHERHTEAAGDLKSAGTFFKSLLKAVLFIPAALFALGMRGLIKLTNKILDSTKLTKGGGGGSKPSGGGAKPSGGGGHEGAHH